MLGLYLNMNDDGNLKIISLLCIQQQKRLKKVDNNENGS